mmetsp:Transcript_31540/g.87962  ORF Transcript_31540/g.87962 Transcript_31540/m.87962 type:complete len:301 (-) Transcript_31540:237-1139(-)
MARDGVGGRADEDEGGARPELQGDGGLLLPSQLPRGGELQRQGAVGARAGHARRRCADDESGIAGSPQDVGLGFLNLGDEARRLAPAGCECGAGGVARVGCGGVCALRVLAECAPLRHAAGRAAWPAAHRLVPLDGGLAAAGRAVLRGGHDGAAVSGRRAARVAPLASRPPHRQLQRQRLPPDVFAAWRPVRPRLPAVAGRQDGVAHGRLLEPLRQHYAQRLGRGLRWRDGDAQVGLGCYRERRGPHPRHRRQLASSTPCRCGPHAGLRALHRGVLTQKRALLASRSAASLFLLCLRTLI